MNSSKSSIIEKEIGPGERLLWTGMPRQGLIFHSSDIIVIPFSLIWSVPTIGISIFMLFTVATSQKASIFDAIGILLLLSPFLAIGIYLLFGRFLLDINTRAHTYYGLSNKRAIIVSGILKRKVKSINLKTITEISFHEKKNGKGSIMFGSTHANQTAPRNLPWPGMSKPAPSFEAIENARSVYEKIRDIQVGVE